MNEAELTDYVAVIPDDVTEKKWRDWLIANNITKDEHQGTHITIIYSPTRMNMVNLFGDSECEAIFETKYKLPKPVVIKAGSRVYWDRFGKEGEYIVLRVCDDTLKRMNQMCQDVGGTMTFANYESHITVDNPCDNLDISELPIPNFDMVFDTLQVTREYMVSD